jgi:histidine triad (HIT) family protein
VSIRHATGAAAGQEVFHFHTHVIPRWRSDEWNSRPASAAELEQVLERITGQCP